MDAGTPPLGFWGGGVADPYKHSPPPRVLPRAAGQTVYMGIGSGSQLGGMLWLRPLGWGRLQQLTTSTDVPLPSYHVNNILSVFLLNATSLAKPIGLPLLEAEISNRYARDDCYNHLI